MTAAKARAVGEVVKVAEGGSVTRPDQSVHTITGGTFVLDEPGIFVVDGDEITVKGAGK